MIDSAKYALTDSGERREKVLKFLEFVGLGDIDGF